MNDFSMTFLEEITNGNRQKLQALAESFLTEAPAGCDRLRTILGRANYHDLKTEAHSLKPLYQSVGSNAALKSVERIEEYAAQPYFHELVPVEVDHLSDLTTHLCNQIKAAVLP